MFEFIGDLDYGIYHIPNETSRIVITSKNIMSEDYLDYPYYHWGELNEKAANDIEKTWSWLKFGEQLDNNKVLEKMLWYQEKYPRTIFLCEQKILDNLNIIGIRDKYNNWQALNTDDMEKRLCELFPNQYNKEGGYLTH